ncbi:MAG: cupin domain-containing protein [Fibrobacteres bacterium]|nr:cupin domain-containing protein [Fibrobacterota bacterium]
MGSDIGTLAKPGPVRGKARIHLNAAHIWDPATWMSPRPGIKVRELYGADDGYRISLVRYASGARVPRHLHTGDEHAYVLEGSVHDEAGEFPVGSYLMRPQGTRHEMWSERGALVLSHRLGPIRFLGGWRPGPPPASEGAPAGAKSVSFPADRLPTAINAAVDSPEWELLRPGVRVLSLFEGPPGNYKSALLRYLPGKGIPTHIHMGDEHIYILAGTQEDDSGSYGAGTYVHNPTGTTHRVWSEEGCLALIHWRAPVHFI